MHELTKEEITINGYKLAKGQYETVINPQSLDVAVLTDVVVDNNSTFNADDYYLDVLSNRVVLREKYEDGYYSLDLMEMVKDNSVDSVKTGINKYTVLPGNIARAAQVQYAFKYLPNTELIDETADYKEPDFDLIMVNDLRENWKSIQLSPVQDLALLKANELVYIHLDKEDSWDLFTGKSVNLNDFVGASPVNVFRLVEDEYLPYREIEQSGSDGNKPVYQIYASDIVGAVYYTTGQRELKIGGK